MEPPLFTFSRKPEQMNTKYMLAAGVGLLGCLSCSAKETLWVKIPWPTEMAYMMGPFSAKFADNGQPWPASPHVFINIAYDFDPKLNKGSVQNGTKIRHI